MQRTHRIALDPTNIQRTYLLRCAGVARFAYNWALCEWKRQYEVYREDPSLPKPSQLALRRQLNSMKRESFPWMIHARTANIRSEWLHKLSHETVCNNAVIVIEDLNVKGMVGNHHLAKSVTDAAFSEFRRQLEYKSEEIGHIVVAADRFYPSSKLCSVCGAKTKHLPLSVISWTCPVCGSNHDRDLNAARNLKVYAASSAVSACGEFLTAVGPKPLGNVPTSCLCEAGTKHQACLSGFV